MGKDLTPKEFVPDLQDLIGPALASGHFTEYGDWHTWDDCVYSTGSFGPCRDGFKSADTVMNEKGYKVAPIGNSN